MARWGRPWHESITRNMVREPRSLVWCPDELLDSPGGAAAFDGFGRRQLRGRDERAGERSAVEAFESFSDILTVHVFIVSETARAYGRRNRNGGCGRFSSRGASL